MCVLDDVCATMHATGEGADQKMLQVSEQHHLMLYTALMLIYIVVKIIVMI